MSTEYDDFCQRDCSPKILIKIETLERGATLPFFYLITACTWIFSSLLSIMNVCVKSFFSFFLIPFLESSVSQCMCNSVSIFLGEIVCVKVSWCLGVVNSGVPRYVPNWVMTGISTRAEIEDWKWGGVLGEI